MAPSAEIAVIAEHDVAAERHDGETYAGVVGNPREERDGEERAHVPPAQDAEQDPCRSPWPGRRSVTAVLSASLPDRLVGQEPQEREVELPHPGQCERAGERDRVKQELAQAAGQVLGLSGILGRNARIARGPGGVKASNA